MNKTVSRCRDAVCSILGNEGLFLLAAFLLRGVLFADPLKWHMEEMTNVYAYFLCPWGGLLVGFRLLRAKEHPENSGKEIPFLALLFSWIVLPFLFRFGFTFNNIVTDIGYFIVFFGLYASIRERDRDERDKRLAEISLLFSILGIIWGGLLLYCAVTGKRFGIETGGIIFGVQGGILYSGAHYNSEGMMAIGCLFIGLALFERKPLGMRILGVTAAVISMFVIILSQSRSSRYAMLIAFSSGVFIKLIMTPFVHNKILHKCIAVGCAAAVLVGGYLLSAGITEMALVHYEKLTQKGTEVSTDENGYHSEAGILETGFVEVHLSSDAVAEEKMTGKARAAIDATFSDRTNVWHNLLSLWRENPKKLVIGWGVGNVGSLIAHDTSHEMDGSTAVHNTFLQFIADFGIIGFLIQICFFAAILPNALRSLAAGAKGVAPGLLSMTMMVIAILAIGMMESAPLGQMTPTNLMLYTALAFLAADGSLAK